MLNFQRIFGIWICCISCMFGTTQLSTSLAQAVPYEYFDDHDQSFYDLDTEQIQAKYDTRLLSQQMLPKEQQHHIENLKDFQNSPDAIAMDATKMVGDGDHRNIMKTRKQNHVGSLYEYPDKLKSNDGLTLEVSSATLAAVDDDDDDDDERSEWLGEDAETVTKAASSTSAFIETLDELYLPRAASCFNNGQKYTHGQKVPRQDNCEVCLCMDGEIFCWWEECDKKSRKASTTYYDFSTPFEESSTIRIDLNPKTTFKTTVKPIKKPKTNENYKYDGNDSAEVSEMQQEYDGLKKQLMQKEHEHEYEQQNERAHIQLQEQHKIHKKQMVKKKIYQQLKEEKYNKKVKEEVKKKKQEEKQQQYRKQQQQKQLKFTEQFEHHHGHNHNRHHNNGSSASSSKILNFPENLPSVLYYDYKTEEHHQYQHQHREQNLKHQKQKEHEKELMQRQQQQQQQQQLHHDINRHHEYGQDFNTYNRPEKVLVQVEMSMEGEGKHHDVNGGEPSTIFKYFANGNEHIYNGDLQTDSDILPEPPTKKPKFSTSITDMVGMVKTTGMPILQPYHMSTPTMTATTTGTITTTAAEKLTHTPTIINTLLKKQISSSWIYNKTNDSRINGNINTYSNTNSNINTDNKSTEDLLDIDDQDDAFHRWLTSTETNNKNNSTLKEANIGGETNGVGDVLNFDASNSDYNMEDKNYENIEFDTETGFSTAITSTKGTMKTMATIEAKSAFETIGEETETPAASIYDDYSKVNEMYGKGQKPIFQQNFNNNNQYTDNNNNNNMANSNEIINGNGFRNKKNSSPFDNIHQNYNQNDNMFGSSTSTNIDSNGNITGNNVSSGGSSNEDNGVANVVNIDIMLTASSTVSQQQQNNIKTTNQQEQHEHQLHNFENEKQIAKTQVKFMQPPVLISNTNDVPLDNNKPLSSIKNDKNHSNLTNIASGGNPNTKIQKMGVNLLNNNNSNSNSLSSSDNFKFKHAPTLLVSKTNPTSSTTTTTTVVTSATSSTATTPTVLSTTSSSERQCNVMGTLYKIGDVLPQDTGNCLQCICIDGSTSDDTPRVTCSPHNCPPLVLPDLFDATGY